MFNVFDVKEVGQELRLRAVQGNQGTRSGDSGYALPHCVMAMHGKVLGPMIGAAIDSTAPGGIVKLDDKPRRVQAPVGLGRSASPVAWSAKYM